MHHPLPLLVKDFFSFSRNRAVAFFLGPCLDFFAVQGIFPSFFTAFHDLDEEWQVPWSNELIWEHNYEALYK